MHWIVYYADDAQPTVHEADYAQGDDGGAFLWLKRSDGKCAAVIATERLRLAGPDPRNWDALLADARAVVEAGTDRSTAVLQLERTLQSWRQS